MIYLQLLYRYQYFCTERYLREGYLLSLPILTIVVNVTLQSVDRLLDGFTASHFDTTTHQNRNVFRIPFQTLACV